MSVRCDPPLQRSMIGKHNAIHKPMGTMTLQIRRNAPLIGVIAVFWLVVAAMVAVNLARSGALAYTLDDAYIHLAIARNWADYGVWGVTRYEWGSTTSSILWTGLLGLLMKLGLPAREWLPFGLNLLFGTAILVVVYWWWQGAFPAANGTFTLQVGARSWRIAQGTIARWVEFFALLFFLFAVPIPGQVQNGMEHLLQILLTLLVMLQTGRIITTPTPTWGKAEAWLLLLIPLMTMSRYENLFVVAAVMVVLAWRRRWGLAVAVLGVALLPLVIYGWISVQNGWYPLPNSLLMKSGFEVDRWADVLMLLVGRNAVERLLFAEGHAIVPIVVLALTALLLKVRLGVAAPSIAQSDTKERETHMVQTALTLFLGTLLLHSMFNSSAAGLSSTRYTGYLYAMILSAVGYVVVRWVARGWHPRELRLGWHQVPVGVTTIALAGLVAFPFVVRGGRELYYQWYGSSNIYEQQVQMGRFLNRYYTGASVAANDIGAINYFADIHCLDLVGLGSLDVAEESRDGSFVTADIDRVAQAHDVTIAILYDKWFPPGSHVAPPDHWITVAHWTISDNAVAASPTITFYAVSPTEAERMRANLAEFAEQLPGRVAYLPTEEQTP
jgi:hypothetical protein